MVIDCEHLQESKSLTTQLLSMYQTMFFTITSSPRSHRRVMLALLLLCIILFFVLYKAASPPSGQSPSPAVPFQNTWNANLQMEDVRDSHFRAIATEVFNSLSSRHEPASFGCEEALKDSNGIFCLPDEQWKRVKKIARRQRLLNMYGITNFQFSDAYVYYQTAWEAEISCPEEMRLGLIGEGGKWLCDPERLLGGGQRKCLVYSVGSNNEYGFEESIHQLYPYCEIHTFDHTVENPTPPGFVKYHKWGVSGTDGPVDADGKLLDRQVYRLPTVISALGHEGVSITVLKIDVEGAEYATFKEYFVEPTPEQPAVPQFNFEQILIEVHSGENYGYSWQEAYLVTHELMLNFVRFGNYAVAHKEPNIASPSRCCSEFVFVKMAPSFIGEDYLTANPTQVLNAHQPPFKNRVGVNYIDVWKNMKTQDDYTPTDLGLIEELKKGISLE
eukprot:Nk52_evm13s263 gene=Nk52_evmTU13s263